MLHRFLRLLGFRNLINNGRSFEELTIDDIPNIVDAHLNGGNKDFQESALVEFLDAGSTNCEMERFLNEIRMVDRDYSEEGRVNGIETPAGREALRLYCQERKLR
jgi:hypothetical protein